MSGLRLGIAVGFTIVLLAGLLPNVAADRGLLPYDRQAEIYEPGQKAIIGWDGQEELLILATDVYGSKNTTVLEIMPFPSLPTVELGSNSTFENLGHFLQESQYIVGQGTRMSRSGDDVEILFHESMGAHVITTTKVNSVKAFEEWLESFQAAIGKGGELPPEPLIEAVGSYIDKGINYFVFDEINVKTDPRSVEPVRYTFKTDFLYYPLVISTGAEGNSEITLFCFTDQDVDWSEIERLGFDTGEEIFIAKSQIRSIDPILAWMLPEGAAFSAHRYKGSIKAFSDDVMLYGPPEPEPRYLSFEAVIVTAMVPVAVISSFFFVISRP